MYNSRSFPKRDVDKTRGCCCVCFLRFGFFPFDLPLPILKRARASWSMEQGCEKPINCLRRQSQLITQCVAEELHPSQSCRASTCHLNTAMAQKKSMLQHEMSKNAKNLLLNRYMAGSSVFSCNCCLTLI